MRTILLLSLLLVSVVAHAQEKKKDFHCFTKVTYKHLVYGLSCPANTTEVVLGHKVFGNSWWTNCGKIEADCYSKTEEKNGND